MLTLRKTFVAIGAVVAFAAVGPTMALAGDDDSHGSIGATGATGATGETEEIGTTGPTGATGSEASEDEDDLEVGQVGADEKDGPNHDLATEVDTVDEDEVADEA